MAERSTGIQMNFEISSDLNLIPEVVKKIIDASAYMFKDLYMFEVAVYEAIYNAIEHGNLEITRKRKEKMIEDGTYDDFLKGISEKEMCREKKVIISSKVFDEKLEICIKDQGRGFDWKKEINNAKSSTGQSPDRFNGYGLRIILTVFDEVFYNEPGNELTLVKYMEKAGENIEKNTDS